MALTDLASTTAVITGGASGIGLATAQALYAQGARVILADRNARGLQEAETRLQAELPKASGSVHSVPTDVRHAEEVRVLMEQAHTITGRIDLVVTCAGIGSGGPIDTFAASEMQRMMDINFMGTFHCIQQALPIMRQQGSGHFICLSSIAGKLGNPFLAGYCASKWAVRGFTSAVRAELEGSGIGITTVYPSWVETPLIHQQGDPMFTNIEALLTPEGVATAMLQAALENRRDLTMVPNPEISRALEIYTADPDKAERKMGQAMRQAISRTQP